MIVGSPSTSTHSSVFNKAFSEGIYPVDDIYFEDFAEKSFVFPADDVRAGKYRGDITPYTKEILHELSPPSKTEIVVFIKPTQIGGTTISNIAVTGIIKHYPGRIMFTFPTDDMADGHMIEKLAPCFEAMRGTLGGILYDGKKDYGKRLLRRFVNGYLELNSASSTGAVRSKSVRYLFLTDVDAEAYSRSAGEGDRIEALLKRTDAFGSNKKIYIESTPRMKGTSLIMVWYEDSSMGKYFVPCPFCGHAHYLDFHMDSPEKERSGFNYKTGKSGIIDAFFVCPQCVKKINETRKYDMMINGAYHHENPDNPIRGFMINSFYSPIGMVSWKQIAKEYERTLKKDTKQDERRQVFFNTRMSMTYESMSKEKINWETLKEQAEDYPLMIVPAGALALGIGVDTHNDRLDIIIVAYSEQEEWIIWAQSLYGDPNEGKCFEQLDSLLIRQYHNDNNVIYRIRSCAIDIGGHRTQAVNRYTRTRGPVVIGIQGARTKMHPLLGAPNKIDVDIGGSKIKGGAMVWNVGRFEAYNNIHANIKSRKLHFSKHLTDEFFAQICANELKNRVTKSGNLIEDWINTRGNGADHYGDCLVYSNAGMSRFIYQLQAQTQQEKMRDEALKVVENLKKETQQSQQQIQRHHRQRRIVGDRNNNKNDLW